MSLRICKKCGEEKPLDNFVFLNLKKPELGRRIVCYKCCYGNRKHFYDNATKNEILNNLQKRFDEQVVKKDGCWDWKGFIRPDGYTRIKYNYKDIGGHVASWMLHNKTIDVPKLNVLHSCDCRKCTNIKHLSLGTYRDNMLDMVNRKRHPGIKLKVLQVRNIKKMLRLGVPISKLAKKYKVHWETINDIKHNRTWKHVK